MNRVVAIGAVMVGLLTAATVLAYIPPPDFLSGRMADKRARMKFRRLQVTMLCRDDASATERKELLYLKTSGLVRRQGPEGEVTICRQGKCFRKQGEAKPTRLPAWSYLPYLYFAEHGVKGSRYTSLFKSLGIDLKVDTVSRFHSRQAVILGAKNWERDRPQFWLDKELYLPLRLMVRDASALVDILWIGWGSKTGGDWFPDRIEIRIDGAVAETCRVTEVKSGVSMPDSLFAW